MRENHYIVTFTNGKSVYVSAGSEEDAEILAKAIMIKKGFAHDAALIRKVKWESADYLDAEEMVEEDDEEGVADLSGFSDRELLDEIERRMRR